MADDHPVVGNAGGGVHGSTLRHLERRADRARRLHRADRDQLCRTQRACRNLGVHGSGADSVVDRAESLASAAVTVAASTFVLDSTAPITSLPASVTGTIGNYLLGETLTFHLDSPTGPALTGSPSVVMSTTSMAVGVTLPVGTTDAPHSVFVVGSGGSVASAAIDIVMPPTLQSMVMRDVDANGKIDTVTVVFDDTLAPYTAGVAPWTLTNVPSGGSLSAVTVSGNTAALSIAEGPGPGNTAVGAFTVALAANSGGIRDLNNHASSFAATAPTDLAAPAAQGLTMQDTNLNGKVDRVTMTFSEALAPYTAPTSAWNLTDVPSGGTLGTVTVTSPTVTLAITEGPGATDTAVGAFTVTLASNAAGVRDATGNLSSFTKTPADGARPIRRSQEMFDDNRNGKIDRVLVVFSEALAPFSAPTSFSLTSPPSGATLNSVGVSGAQATLALDEGAGAATTAVGSFRVTLTANPAGIHDASGNLASYAATAPTDRAAPALVTLSLLDNNGNGKVDRVTALFSETLQAYTAGTAPWTLANVPSGGTLASAARSGATITLTLTEARVGQHVGRRDDRRHGGQRRRSPRRDRQPRQFQRDHATRPGQARRRDDHRHERVDRWSGTAWRHRGHHVQRTARARVRAHFDDGHPDRPHRERQRHAHDGRSQQRSSHPGVQQLRHLEHRRGLVRKLCGGAGQLGSDRHRDGRPVLRRNRVQRTRPADDQCELLVRRCADADGHDRQHRCDRGADAEHPDVLTATQPPTRFADRPDTHPRRSAASR